MSNLSKDDMRSFVRICTKYELNDIYDFLNQNGGYGLSSNEQNCINKFNREFGSDSNNIARDIYNKYYTMKRIQSESQVTPYSVGTVVTARSIGSVASLESQDGGGDSYDRKRHRAHIRKERELRKFRQARADQMKKFKSLRVDTDSQEGGMFGRTGAKLSGRLGAAKASMGRSLRSGTQKVTQKAHSISPTRKGIALGAQSARAAAGTAVGSRVDTAKQVMAQRSLSSAESSHAQAISNQTQKTQALAVAQEAFDTGAQQVLAKQNELDTANATLEQQHEILATVQAQNQSLIDTAQQKVDVAQQELMNVRQNVMEQNRQAEDAVVQANMKVNRLQQEKKRLDREQDKLDKRRITAQTAKDKADNRVVAKLEAKTAASNKLGTVQSTIEGRQTARTDATTARSQVAANLAIQRQQAADARTSAYQQREHNIATQRQQAAIMATPMAQCTATANSCYVNYSTLGKTMDQCKTEEEQCKAGVRAQYSTGQSVATQAAQTPPSMLNRAASATASGIGTVARGVGTAASVVGQVGLAALNAHTAQSMPGSRTSQMNATSSILTGGDSDSLLFSDGNPAAPIPSLEYQNAVNSLRKY